VDVIWILVIALAASLMFFAAPGTAGPQATIRVWHQEQPPHRVKRVQELIDEFNKANPGIVVKQEVQNWADAYQKTLSAVQAGTQPDVQFTIPDFTTTVKETGAVQPVTALVKELDQQYRYLRSATEPYFFEGQYWAVPLWGMSHLLWYRKDILRANGVETAPRTWDELLATAKKLTKGGKFGIGLPANKHLYTDQTIYNLMITAKAEDLFDAQGRVIFNNPRTVRAYAMYRDLWQYSPKDSVNWTWGEAEAALNAGQAAFIFQFTTVFTFDKQSGRPPADLGAAPIPWPTDGQRGSIYYSNAAMVLTKDKAKQEAIAKFLRFLMEPRNYGRFLNMEPALFLPATEAGMKAESYWADPVVVKYRSQVQAMVEQSRYGALFGFTKGRVFPAIGKISAQNLLAQVVQKVIVDRMAPADAVKWGQQQMEALTKK
jgi:multiple sugar transport system substrate-binding protein